MRPATLEHLEQQTLTAMRANNWPLANSLGTLLNKEAARETGMILQPLMIDEATRYAEHGFHIFPLQPGKKIPMPGSHGCKDATTDLDQISAWWTATPDANIGLATGHQVDVIDIDGLTGWLSLQNNPNLLDGLEIVAHVSTPRPGGHHIYVRTIGLKNGANVLPGIDIRGAGGYVVAPPSTVTLDDYAGTYRWAMRFAEEPCVDAQGEEL